jgi:hypothetical protein
MADCRQIIETFVRAFLQTFLSFGKKPRRSVKQSGCSDGTISSFRAGAIERRGIVPRTDQEIPMRRRLAAAFLSEVALLAASFDQASTTGAPGTPNAAPDPCRTCRMPEPIELPDNRRQAARRAPNPAGNRDVQRRIDNSRGRE